MNPKAVSSLRFVAGFTALPNALIDEVMPTLKDTEWRLLCVIVRQTLGWIERDGQRKSRDWLAQRQLIARTGRNSAALSGAIDALIQCRLICAWDKKGELLPTPQSRRCHRGRVYYGLCPEIVSQWKIADEKSPLYKVNRTKETEVKEGILKGSKVKETPGAKNPRADRPSPVTHSGWTKAGEVISAKYLPMRPNRASD